MNGFDKVLLGGKRLLALPNLPDELAKTLNRIAVFDATSGAASIAALRADLGLLIGLVAVAYPDELQKAFAIHQGDAKHIQRAVADPAIMESVVQNEANAMRAKKN